MAMQLYPHISADPSVLSGRPVIEGTSVPVSQVISEVAAGKTLAEVASEHGVSVEEARAALEYAAQRASEPVVQPGAGSIAEDEAQRLGIAAAGLSPLGRRLLELRAQGIAAGEPAITTWEALDAEIAERRGGYPDIDA